MDFHTISNPPFSIDFTKELIEHTIEQSINSILLCPLSCISKEYIKRIKSFEKIETFEHFDIEEQSCLFIFETDRFNHNIKEDTLLLSSFDSRYYLFYKYNFEHSAFSVIFERDKNPISERFENEYFIETSKIPTSSVSGFSLKGDGFKFNVLKSKSAWLLDKIGVRFNSVKEKDNFCKWWYYYDTDKVYNKINSEKSLSRIISLGLLSKGLYKKQLPFVIPAIDWIKIEQNPLWKSKKYDEAVLDEMGLKFINENKETGVEFKSGE